MSEVGATCLTIDTRNLEFIKIDGPALQVKIRTQCARLFPLRRLSRIHVIGKLCDGIESLLHCAESQVPVAFFTRSGKLRCQLYYPVFESSVLSHWLDHVDFDCQVKEVYSDWLSHQTSHLLSNIGLSDFASPSRGDLLLSRLNGLCRERLGKEELSCALQWLFGMLSAHLSQLVVSYGLGNQSRGKKKLMGDMTPILELAIRYFLLQKASRKKLHVSATTMSFFYSQHHDEIDTFARQMLYQLASRLEAIV